MKRKTILIDLIHPANVHYFKSFIFKAQANGYRIVITARNKDVLQQLLVAYDLPYINMGVGRIGKGAIGKMLYLFKAFALMIYYILKYKPLMVLSFSSTACALSSWLLRTPHISFDDTEHANLNRILYTPFTKFIATPFCFNKDIGPKQFRFNAYMELFYLHPKRFKPNIEVLKEVGITQNEAYVVLRFVSWGAFHDIGQSGFSYNDKIQLVNEIKEHARVLITSESELPVELKPFQIRIGPEKIHDLLAFAKLYVGEGATMASECAMLGTPAIYVNTLTAGTLEQQESDGLLKSFRSSEGVLAEAMNLLKMNNIKEVYNERRLNMLSNMIDPTSFLYWLVDNYPNSIEELTINPNKQFDFK